MPKPDHSLVLAPSAQLALATNHLTLLNKILLPKTTAAVPVSVGTTTDAAPQVGQPYTIADLNLTLMPIPAGTFIMGSPESESEMTRTPDESPQTRVTISRPFWLGKYVVTQAEWTAMMGNNPSKMNPPRRKQRGIEPSPFKGAQLPVQNVSYDDVLAFCAKVTKHERATGRLPSGYVYTLPTEAQWEYACRAGTTGAYAGTGNWDDMGWYKENSGGTTHPVGQKLANAWGLYDMHGNVREFCLDWHEDLHPGGSVTDPTGTVSGSYRLNRGGCFDDGYDSSRSACRFGIPPDERSEHIGFRLALSSVG